MAIKPHECKPGCFHGDQGVSEAVSAYPVAGSERNVSNPTACDLHLVVNCNRCISSVELYAQQQEDIANGAFDMAPSFSELTGVSWERTDYEYDAEDITYIDDCL